MLYMKEHKLLFFLPWVFFLYNKIKIKWKKINEKKSVFIEEKESQLCQVHIIFTEGQFAAAERKRKERRDKMTHLLSVKATHHRLCETRITGRTILFCLLQQSWKNRLPASVFILFCSQLDGLLYPLSVHTYHVSRLLFFADETLLCNANIFTTVNVIKWKTSLFFFVHVPDQIKLLVDDKCGCVFQE